MLKRIKKMLTSDPVQDTVTEEIAELKPMEPVQETAPVDPKIDEEPESDDEYISDEEWEAMTPEQKAEIEAEEAEYDDEEDDGDYISDEEWEAMSDEEKRAWEEEEQVPGPEDEDAADTKAVPENVEDEDDPDYIKTSPEVVGYDDLDQQMDMYDIATEMIEPGESILDFGCGRGDLSEFLYRRDGEVPKYKGVDINEPLINTGIEKYAPDVNLECKDWNKIEDVDRSNWCVNIGSLCTRYDGSSKDDLTLVTETLDKMMTLCTMGSVLVLFSSYMPKEVREEEFLITDPMKVFDYAMKKYGRDTGNVSIDHSYSDSAYKITVLRQQ
tara:strand:+ start:1038 stop:2018 length:981 start_codon:yes stop_codon:yes gene_type:complete